MSLTISDIPMIMEMEYFLRCVDYRYRNL